MPRVPYAGESVQFWHSQLVQTGAGVNVFAGQPYQRGQHGAGIGSFFRSLWRSVSPVLWKIGKTAGKAVGKQALASGVDLIGDIVKGEQVLPSLEARGKEAVSALAERASKHLQQQEGSGLGIGPMGIGSVRSVRGAKRGGKPRRKKRAKQSGSGRKQKRKATKRAGRKKKVKRRPAKKSHDIFS